MSDLKKLLSKKYGSMYHGDTPPTLHRESTGYAGLDVILGGGLPMGRLIQMAAPPSTGKTTTCLSIIRNLLDRGIPCAYIDLERTCDEHRLTQLGVKGENFHYIRPSDGETALEFAVEAAALGIKLVVIDSVPNLLPKTVMESDMGKHHYSPTAKLLGNEQSKLVSVFEQTNSCLMFINQVRENVGSMYGGKTNPGGYALKHALSINIEMFRKENYKDGSGMTIAYKTQKNKTCNEGIVCEIAYYHDERSLCKFYSLREEAVKKGLITQSGAFYKLNEELAKTFNHEGNIGQGKDKAQAWLADHIEVYNTLYSLINS